MNSGFIKLNSVQLSDHETKKRKQNTKYCSKAASMAEWDQSIGTEVHGITLNFPRKLIPFQISGPTDENTSAILDWKQYCDPETKGTSFRWSSGLQCEPNCIACRSTPEADWVSAHNDWMTYWKLLPFQCGPQERGMLCVNRQQRNFKFETCFRSTFVSGATVEHNSGRKFCSTAVSRWRSFGIYNLTFHRMENWMSLSSSGSGSVQKKIHFFA